jgi:hypothetical protein
MPTFLLTHHFPDNFETSPETAAAARAWFERLGTHHAGGGNPTFQTRRLGNCTVQTRLVAHTLISADDADGAIAVAEAWPLLVRGGGVEVKELTVNKALG